ncbi:O-methyltransferase [Mangrovimonas cancribranchiae]|uniref:Class I SAM-dependent methyltransferase n=1 Tax=Mangrovimonas cancribranchiae TaxID=3080055 RepID=A0AAU6P8U3_9FLAO
MWYRIKTYLRFLWQSTNQHGVHSPFVYQLVTTCFYDTKPYAAYKALKAYRKQLLKNNTIISVTDLGPGSQQSNTPKRHIATIAKHSGSTLVRTKFLYRLTQYFSFETSLELGTSLGLATQALCLGHKNNHITTIEGCPKLSEIAQENLLQYHKQLTFITGDFSKTLKQISHPTYDMIFFDGNHTKKATLSYFETLLHYTHNDTVFIFDDIYWSKDMTEAWETIKQHPKVTVTIDTYFWGLVFFRTEQAKQHFKIRL